jgi:hypothetical protein
VINRKNQIITVAPEIYREEWKVRQQMNRKRVGCTCNKLPLGICFMHPPKKSSRSRKHKK